VGVVLLWTSSNLHFQQVREAILTKIQFSSTVQLASCFQFDSLNRRDDLKVVSKLTIFPCLRLILRLLKETYSYVQALTIQDTDFSVRRNWWLYWCCFTSSTYSSCSFYFYVARSLSAIGKTFLNSYRVLHVFCPAVLAVHVKESNGIYATIQSSETHTFCEKLLRGKFSEFRKRCRKYSFKYITEAVQGDKKNGFWQYVSASEGQTTARNKKKTSLNYQCPNATTLSTLV